MALSRYDQYRMDRHVNLKLIIIGRCERNGDGTVRHGMRALDWIRPALPVLAAAGLGLVVAGCEQLGLPGPGPNSAMGPAATAEPTPPPPPRKPAPPGQAIARLPPAEEVEPPPGLGLDRLIGLDQPHVAGILGEPRARAESPPATIWRYAGPGCDLDVYFYLDLQSQTMRALHYEVRSHDSPERSAQRCYEALVSERRANAEPAAGPDRPR